MALSARPIGLSAAQSVASGHPASGGRNIASAAFTPINEASIKAEIHPDANFYFHDFSAWMHDRNQNGQDQRPQSSEPFATNTTTFVSLLKQSQIDNDANTPTAHSKRSFQSLLSKAIRAYESTATVISDRSKSLGSSLSLSL